MARKPAAPVLTRGTELAPGVSLATGDWFRHDPARDLLILELHVQPGASGTGPAGLHGERLRVRVAAPPVESKANRLLIDFVGKMFGVPASRVTIVRGQTGRLKTVHVQGPIPHLSASLQRLVGAGVAARGSA